MGTDVAAAAVASDAIRLVARVRDPLALTAALHDLALRALGAHVSVVLQPGAAGEFRVTSAAGLDASPLEAWMTSRAAAAAAGRAIAADGPLVLATLDRDVPELSRMLGAAGAVLAPLVLREGAPGLFLAGFAAESPAVDPAAVAVLAGAFTLGLDRSRYEQETELERDLRGLTPAPIGESYPAIGPALQAYSRSLAWLFRADLAEIWQHDRATRELVLAAASDGRASGTRIAAADDEALAARGLRLAGAEIFGLSDSSGGPIAVSAPLRGRRRALGALVLTGVRLDASSPSDLVARVDQIAQGLAGSLENAQLLDDVIRSHREVRDLAGRLARTEKVLALGHFVAGIAHELNNPLQGVIGHLELIRASRTLPPDLARDIALVQREADRAARIVTNLLLFAGSGRIRARAVHLNSIVARVVRLRAKALEAARISLVKELADPGPLVRADALLLQQALLNVVLNAEHAMTGGGRLVVRTEAPEGGRATVVVEDSGPGLSDEVRARLFEPFFTTKAPGQGTGMGLAIAFGILRAHEGAITAGNLEDGGARFVLSLPAMPPRHRMKRAAIP